VVHVGRRVRRGLRRWRSSHHCEQLRLAETPQGTEVVATIGFALDVGLVGGLLDATIIKRQRRRELNAQFDALEPPAD